MLQLTRIIQIYSKYAFMDGYTWLPWNSWLNDEGRARLSQSSSFIRIMGVICRLSHLNVSEGFYYISSPINQVFDRSGGFRHNKNAVKTVDNLAHVQLQYLPSLQAILYCKHIISHFVFISYTDVG